MAAAVYSFSKPSGVHSYVAGNRRVRFFDFTSDTGDYAAGGVTKTAASLGFKRIDFVTVQGAATSGTDGATATPLGVTILSSGSSVKFQVYESGASGAPGAEKTAEAMPANFAVRLKVEGV